jgi:hypothetical protein
VADLVDCNHRQGRLRHWSKAFCSELLSNLILRPGRDRRVRRVVRLAGPIGGRQPEIGGHPDVGTPM